MQTLLFADRSQHGLTALQSDSSTALVPLAGKAVIEYSLEELADAGVKDVIVVLGPEASRLRAFLGNGERWGLSLRIALSRGDEDPSQLIARLGGQLQDEFLALRGDELRSRAVSSFLSRAATCPGTNLFGEDCEGSVAMILAADHSTNLSGLHRQGQNPTAKLHGEALLLPDLALYTLETPRQVLEANRALTTKTLAGVLRAGVELANNLRGGKLCKIDPQQMDDAAVYAGDHAQAHPSVLLKGFVVIGADSYIDKKTSLENCVVLPGTYVGGGLQLRDCIVSTSGVLKAGSSRLLPIPDPMWLGAVNPDSVEKTSLPERLVAMLLLILSLPVWPVAALYISAVCRCFPLGKHTSDIHQKTTVSNPVNTASWRWAGGPAWLQILPGLWDVARGHLRLIGSQSASQAAYTGQTGRIASTACLPAGLISPAHLHLDKEAPEEEIWMTELLYAQSSFAQKIRYLVSGQWYSNKSTASTAPLRGTSHA